MRWCRCDDRRFRLFFAALADDWPPRCLLDYVWEGILTQDRRKTFRHRRRGLWGVQYGASRGSTLPVGRSLLSANALPFRYLTGRPFDALIWQERRSQKGDAKIYILNCLHTTGEIGCEWLQQMQREALIIASAISRCVDKVLNCCCTIFGQPYVCQLTYRPHPRSRCIQSVCNGWMNNEPESHLSKKN